MAHSPRAFKIVLRIFAYGGIALICFGALMLGRTLVIAAFGERAEGVVIDNVWTRGTDNDTAQAVVRFEVDGRTVEFKSAVGTSPPLHHVDDRVTIFYWPSKPEDAVIAGFAEWYLRPIILASFGLVFLAIGGGFLWGPAWFARKRQRILAEGVPIQATVIAIRQDTSLEVNEQSPWVIDAEFKDEITGQTVACTSHYIWSDPKREYPVGSKVTVYYLPDELDKYAFQVEKIEKTQENE
jgi:hypothetical protein